MASVVEFRVRSGSSGHVSQDQWDRSGHVTSL